MTPKKDVLATILSQQDIYLANTDVEDYILSPLLDEINYIQTHSIKNFVRSMLLKVEHFWQIPAHFDETNRFMPDENIISGNVLHTKRVFRTLKVMLESYSIDPIDEDIAYAAAILHDITKGIVTVDYNPEYDPFHAYTVDKLYTEVNKYDQKYTAENQSSTLYIEEENVQKILRLIRCHMGPWSPIPETYPVDELEMMLHYANRIAHSLAYIVDGDEIVEARWQINV